MTPVPPTLCRDAGRFAAPVQDLVLAVNHANDGRGEVLFLAVGGAPEAAVMPAWLARVALAALREQEHARARARARVAPLPARVAPRDLA